MKEPIPSINRPTGYHEILYAYNTRNHDRLRAQLHGLVQGSDYAIAITGSDGRYEKSQELSPVELILITSNTKSDLSEVYNLQNTLGFDETFESKELGVDNPLFFLGKRNIVYPSRVFDAEFLIGNEDMFEEYIMRTGDEINKGDSKRYVRHAQKTCKRARRDLRKGNTAAKHTTFPCVDMNTGQLFYDPANYVKATKNGFLRSVQYKISHEITAAVADGRIHPEKIVDMPTNLTQRLHYFHHNNDVSINERELADIVYAYQHALYWHHLSEEQFKQGKQTFVDVNTLTEVAKIIESFASNPLLR